VQYRFILCDVFSAIRFGGNPLAILPAADGLSSSQMQSIAREFNFSESTFVLPAESGGTRKVRIFTPSAEVPFAGHPNVGTAFALANDGAFGEIGAGITVTFEEAAGNVPVTIRRDADDLIWCELMAPQPLSLGVTVDARRIAAALNLDIGDIETANHVPQVASVGLPFLFVELTSYAALRRARADASAVEKLKDDGIVPDLHLYVQSKDDFDIRARMFAPLFGVPEDPATGSANCALAALLTQLDTSGSAGGSWRIAQGVEMGRPSVLQARTSRKGETISAWIGGHSVLVADGFIELD
jgi:trans-2,3-dihydro-3-hydroxyanthranilate isomerase